jgi:hypothetical protein
MGKNKKEKVIIKLIIYKKSESNKSFLNEENIRPKKTKNDVINI